MDIAHAKHHVHDVLYGEKKARSYIHVSKNAIFVLHVKNNKCVVTVTRNMCTPKYKRIFSLDDPLCYEFIDDIFLSCNE